MASSPTWSTISNNDIKIPKKPSDPQLAVVLNRVLIVFFDIVREVVDRDVVVLDVLHDLATIINSRASEQRAGQTDPLPETAKFRRGQRVGLANDGDHVDARGEAAHKFNVHLPQTVQPTRQKITASEAPSEAYACPVGGMK